MRGAEVKVVGRIMESDDRTAASIRRLEREALSQVALLVATYLVIVLMVRTSGDGWLARMELLAHRAVVDVVLVLGCATLAYGALGLVPSVRIRSLGFTVFVLCCYVVFAAQLVFFRETGTFFSGTVALYALRNLTELGHLLFASVSNFASAGIVMGMLGVFFVSVAALQRHKWQLWSLLLLLPAVLVLAMQAGAVSRAGMGRALTSESLLVALVQPAYPRTAVSEIPAYTAPAAALAPAPGALPDIVVVVLESTRAISVPPYESGSGPRALMPNLAALAREARVFKRAYTTTSHTSKALVGIFCGVHPYPEMAVIESRERGLPADCLPAVLGRAGYRSLFMQSATEHFENRRGLVANMGFQSMLFKEQIREGYVNSGYFGLDEAALAPRFAEWWATHGDAPRFAAILTSMTHHPYQEIGKPAPSGAEDQRQAYLNVLAYTDGVLGEIIGTIKASGRAGNTILIVTGDHGESFGEHGPRQHDSVPFEEVTRVPMLLWDGGGRLEVGEDASLRQHTDLYPTLIRLAGGTVTGGPGIELFDGSGHAEITTSCWYANACMTKLTDQKKWVYFPSTGQVHAFDLERDPDELHNIAGHYPAGALQDAAMFLLRHEASVKRYYEQNGSSLADTMR